MFARRPKAEELRGEKRIVVNRMKFIIRRINPLLDFPDGKMPMVFTSFISRRPEDPNQQLSPDQINKLRDDIGMVIRAGVVDPPLVPPEKANEGITVDDIFRDMETARKLYFEIMVHALNRFTGFRGVFFSMRIRHLLFTAFRDCMGSLQLT
jgi:hypothetical protein